MTILTRSRRSRSVPEKCLKEISRMSSASGCSLSVPFMRREQRGRLRSKDDPSDRRKHHSAARIQKEAGLLTPVRGGSILMLQKNLCIRARASRGGSGGAEINGGEIDGRTLLNG